MNNYQENHRNIVTRALKMLPKERQSFIKDNYVTLKIIEGQRGNSSIQAKEADQLALLNKCIDLLTPSEEIEILEPLRLQLGSTKR